MTHNEEFDLHARCPRCGYDQRGVVAAWSDQCPLNGVCSECGLQWWWGLLLNPSLQRPTWCVEFAPRWRALPKRCIKTLGMAMTPWLFWRWLTIFHEPRWLRQALYLLFLLFIVYAAFCARQGFNSWMVWRQLSAPVSMSGTIADNARPLSPTAGVGLPNASANEAILRAFFLPLSGQTSGILTTTSMRWLLPSPKQLLRDRTMMPLQEMLAFMFGVTLLCPIGFVLLPVSRHQHQVQWSHVVRITLYSFSITAIVSIFVCLFASDDGLAATRYGVWMDHTPVPELVYHAFPFALFIWWGYADSRYLQMTRPWGIALALVSIATLVTFAIDLKMRGFMFWF